MRNGIEVGDTHISYPRLSANQNIIAITSLASPKQAFGQSQNLPNIPKEFDKYLNPISLRWLHQQNIGMDRMAIAQQVRGSDARYIDAPGVYRSIDGFYTDQPEIYMTIRTADCAAVFVSIPEVPAIGIAHVGWRGAKANIIANLLCEMTDKWKLDAKQIRIAVSPHIRSCCYGVGGEFTDHFQPQYLEQHNNQLYLDLEKVIVDQLKAFNIRDDRISVSEECTFCSSLSLYSYRKQNKTGNRLLSVIAIPNQ